MTKAGILGFSFIVLSFHSCQQEEIILHGEISGTVINSSTGLPVVRATVRLTPTNDSTKTDSSGMYVLRRLTPGKYGISVSKPNYAERTIDTIVNSASTTDIDIQLDSIHPLLLKYSLIELDFGFDLNSLSFTISRRGTGKIGYIITPSKKWITVNPNSGEVDSETDNINVTINRTGLTQKRNNQLLAIRSTYNQYVFLDTISVKVWIHNPIVFNTELTYGNVSDAEGNVYKTIQIGTQTWMAENLRATKFNDNTSIPLVADNNQWSGLTTPAYCWYDNDLYYKTDYGALYNWYTVSTGKLCPTGWHVPSVDEWNTLTDRVGNEEVYFNLKEIGIYHWDSPNEWATNKSGFTALPAGKRTEEDGSFVEMGMNAVFWCTDQENGNQAYYGQILQGGGTNYVAWTLNKTDTSFGSKSSGCSVRCVKD